MSVPDTWVPVPIRWRYVVAGDVMVADDGQLWLIAAHGDPWITTAVRTLVDKHSAPVDPDDIVTILVPATERDAVELTREQLAARLEGRTT